jgi:hypothetical protein
MSTYIAPLRDMQFVLNEVAGLEEVCALPGNEECSVDLVDSILDEAAKFATGVLDPINRGGDSQGAVCKDGVVTTSPGFKDAYKLFVETGWNAMPFSPEFGGQGLPAVVTMAVNEMWKSANMAFGAVPDADWRRHRSHRPPRLRRTEAEIPAEDGRRHLDRHDEPDRAERRLRSRRHFQQGQGGRRWQLSGQRHQDFHHLGRERRRREHHSPRAGPSAGCAAGTEGHFAVPRAEIPGQ